jgi:hypothetical protein
MKKPGSASNSIVWSTLVLPKKIQTPFEFERSIVKVRTAFTGTVEQGKDGERFLNLMYYLLGFMVGDAGKNFSSKPTLARLELAFCRKHPENLILGTFVISCVLMLGIPCTRIADSPPKEREPHGAYRWQSYFSEVVAWLFTSCLGLRSDELTSYDPVRMSWLLSAAYERRVWFLRGVADSDGGVNIRNRTVQITTEPNTELFQALFSSLNVHSLACMSKGTGTLSITASDALKLQIFNPEVETHRGCLLKRLANARTFQYKWPEWLETKVCRMLKEGLDISTIRNRILFEDDTYVKLKTIKSRRIKNG